MEGRKEERKGASFMARGRKEGAPSPQAHLSSDAHAAAAAAELGSAMCAGRGDAASPSQPRQKRIPSLKQMPAMRRPARGDGGPARLQ